MWAPQALLGKARPSSSCTFLAPQPPVDCLKSTYHQEMQWFQESRNEI